jgi:hypothetical protein
MRVAAPTVFLVLNVSIKFPESSIRRDTDRGAGCNFQKDFSSTSGISFGGNTHTHTHTHISPVPAITSYQ